MARSAHSYWVHSAPDIEPGEGQRECARAVWCSAKTRAEDGTWYPALTYQAFCPADRSAVGSALSELPHAYVRLALTIGEPLRGARVTRVPPGPRLPLSAAHDMLMRLITESVVSWEERVRTVARLVAADTELARRRRDGFAVQRAVTLLSAHLDPLLALPAEPMVRTRADTAAIEDLDGTGAGLELLDLARRARRILGETRPPRETFDGIPCRACEAMGSLERAEPPSDPGVEAKKSRCCECRDEMTPAEFTEWTSMNAAWTRGAGVAVCRRCGLGMHEECRWDACSCAGTGHAAA